MVGGGGGVLKVAWFSLKEVSLPPLLEGRETPNRNLEARCQRKFGLCSKSSSLEVVDIVVEIVENEIIRTVAFNY